MVQFGHKLPDPVWLHSNTGKQNGELRFIQYPNRDVSAHTWSAEEFEWVELGRYSCTRKIIEGKVWSSGFLQHIRAFKGRRPSLAYFAELAKEYPRYCESRPAVVMPPLSSMHPKNAVQQRLVPLPKPAPPEPTRYDSLSTVSSSLHENEFPTLSSLTLRDRPAPVSKHAVTTTRPGNTPQGLGAPADDPFATESSTYPRTNMALANPSEGPRKHMVQPDPGKMDFDFRFPLGASVGSNLDTPSAATETERRAFFVEQERSRAEKMRQSFAPSDRSDIGSECQVKTDDTSLSAMANMLPKATAGLTVPASSVQHVPKKPWPGHGLSATAMAAKASNAPLQPHPNQPMQQPNESRARMLEYLNRISDERSIPVDSPQDLRGLQPPEAVNKTITNTSQMVVHDKPTSSGSQVSRSALRTSDPEPGYYENRHADIYNSLDIDGPTPQNFDGPFFQDDMPTQANPTVRRATRRPRGEDLDEWWNSALLKDRQTTFSKALVGPGGGKDDKNFMVTERILFPVYENLMSYKRIPGMPSKDPDYFARFAPPPEWAIDRSRDGDKSFFGEDWGETPRRIGRDPRYKPTFGQSRYTLFEEQREEPSIRLPPEMRGSPSGSNYPGGSNYASGSSYPGSLNYQGGYFMPPKH